MVNSQITIKELQDIISKLRTGVYNFRSNINLNPDSQANLIEAAFWLALKKNELITLTIGDVTIDEQGGSKAIFVTLADVNKITIPPVAQSLIYSHYQYALSRSMSAVPDQPLYPDKRNKFLSPKQADRNMDQVQKLCGVTELGHEYIRQSGIRHYYSNQIIKLTPIEAVAKTAEFARVGTEEVAKIVDPKPPHKKTNWLKLRENDPDRLIMKIYDNIQFGYWNSFSKQEIHRYYNRISQNLLSHKTTPEIRGHREAALDSIKNKLIEMDLW